LTALPSLCVAAENVLKNPSFESLGPDGIPVGWEREYNERLSGPFAVAEGAHDGEKCVRLMTEEWVLERPQFIVQDAVLPKDAKALRLSAWCRGQGLMRLAIHFRKEGKALETETIKQYFGEYVLPKETEKVFGLAPEYREYEVHAEVPEGADGVRVRLGNTIGRPNLANVWGTAWIDSVSLTAVEAMPPPATEPTLEATEKIKTPKGCRDVAGLVHIRTDPPTLNTKRLIDGKTGSPGTNLSTRFGTLIGTGRYPSYTLVLPEPVPVQQICLHLRGNADVFTVRADLNGDGEFTELLARAEAMSGVTGWVVVEGLETPVHAIRVRGIEGRLRGYRRASFFVDEFKLFTPTERVQKNWYQLMRKAVYTGRAYVGAGPVQASTRRIRLSLPEPETVKRFQKILTTDFWMFGVAVKKDVKVIDYRKSPNFKTVVDCCSRAGFDSILIFQEGTPGNLAPWPSKVCNPTDENVLKALADAVHSEGLKLYMMVSSRISPPYPGHTFLYPKEETSRYPQTEQLPGITHGTHYRDTWLAIQEEVMACGIDGVSLCPDENYYKGHFMETFPKDDPARALYEKRFGKPLPEHEEDSLAFRQWIVMRHEGICDLYGYWSKKLKAKYPGLKLFSRFMQPSCHLHETGIPLDLLGARGGLDEISSDYLGPYGIQMMVGANGWRKGGMCYDASIWGPLQGAPRKSDMTIQGEILWSVMYGLGAIDIYRQNYLVLQGTLPGFARAFETLRQLENLGVYDARPPKKIAFLSSRASLDWWQVRSWWGKHEDPNHDRAVEAMRGWFSEKVAFNILQHNGQPFDWLYLDRMDQLQDLEDYKVLVIPFAYSIGNEAAGRVKAAAGKGAKLILFDGKSGPTDQWGEPRPTPVLKGLVDSGSAVLLEDDILKWGATDVFVKKAMDAVTEALGEDQPLRINTYGRHVDASVLEKGPKEKFVFLLNWEKVGGTRMDLGIPMPEGTYEVLVRDMDFWYQMSIDGESKLSAEQLKSFRMWMVPETSFVLHIREAGSR